MILKKYRNNDTIFVDCECDYCYKNFTKYYCEVNNNYNRHYCCKICFRKGRDYSYHRGENNPFYGKRGKLTAHWKGGRKMHSDGYVEIYKPEHPRCGVKGYVFEHRLIMEKMIGRYLNPEEIVHHKNEIKDDNRKDNLMLFNGNKGHNEYHKEVRGKTA